MPKPPLHKECNSNGPGDVFAVRKQVTKLIDGKKKVTEVKVAWRCDDCYAQWRREVNPYKPGFQWEQVKPLRPIVVVREIHHKPEREYLQWKEGHARSLGAEIEARIQSGRLIDPQRSPEWAAAIPDWPDIPHKYQIRILQSFRDKERKRAAAALAPSPEPAWTRDPEFTALIELRIKQLAVERTKQRAIDDAARTARLTQQAEWDRIRREKRRAKRHRRNERKLILAARADRDETIHTTVEHLDTTSDTTIS